MGLFDNYNYEINARLPEYWKSDIFLKPIERFSALLMKDTIQRFMEKIGVLQPFMVWKTLPEEYHYEYGFDDYDIRLASKEENPNCNQTLMLSPTNHIVAQLPLTKRNVHAYIVIDLSSLSFSDSTEYTEIQELIIKNADQTLKIKDINSKTLIEIYTESNTILINDSEPKKGQVEGNLDIIKREARDPINTITDPLDINEKCELEIYINSGESAYCDLYVKLYYPVYVTEQNIRVSTLSAFPLEYIRLYGYMCHKYNNNHQWVYLWEKKYGYQDRIVYDKIAKQYDCEIFYAEIKLYGLPAPMYVGFPASYADSTDGVFVLNESLDYWGEIFHIPRRIYKTDISEEQERYCFPKYYGYSVEQDFPYEQRLINEYKYNEDWQDYINITDTDGTDIALVRCKDPYIENIYMYTETIPPVDLLNSKTTYSPNCIRQIEEANNINLNQGQWTHPENLRYDSNSYSIVTLNNQNENNITDKSYQSNLLEMTFDLSSLPENCKIKGMQLKFKGVTNTHADNIYIDDRSFLKYTQKIKNETNGNHYWQTKEIPLSNFFDIWTPDNASYVLGYEDSIFFEDKPIDRDSIEKGYLQNGVYQTNKIKFEIGFSNLSDYLDLIIKLFNIQLIVYFDLIKEDIQASIDIPNKTIIYDTENDISSCIDINLHFVNTGEIKEIDYNSFIILPSELCFVNFDDNLYHFNNNDSIKEFLLGNKTTTDYITENQEYNILHIDEQWNTSIKIGANNNPSFKSGRYDILIICGDKIIEEEIYVYDKTYALNNKISNNVTYLQDDIILSFVEDYYDAIDGCATVKLQLQDKTKMPIPFQYITIKKDSDKNDVYYYFLDGNGEISLSYDVPRGVVLNASYANIKTSCKIYSFYIDINMFKQFKSYYNVTQTDDLYMLSWALVKNLSDIDVPYIIQQIQQNAKINQSSLSGTEFIEQGYQTNIYLDRINRHDNYTLIYTANIVKTNTEDPDVKENPCFVTGLINMSDIQQNITDGFLIKNNQNIFQEVEND